MSRHPEAKHSGVKSLSIQNPSHSSRVQAPGVQSPSLQNPSVHSPRFQAPRRPEFKCPDSKRLGFQSPSVQTMRPEPSFSCMPLQCPLFSALEVNESRYIALLVFSQSIKKLFSIDCVNIYLFLIFFSIDFAQWKRVGLPHVAYISIH